jgi:hypothetical protein
MTIDRGDAVNLVRDLRGYGDNALKKITLNGLWCLFDAIERMDEALRASPPEAEGEAVALLRIWLERLDYSDPHGDKPKVKAYLSSRSEGSK